MEKGYPGEAERLVGHALDRGIDPLRMMEEAMMLAMRSVGVRYKNDETDILRILTVACSVRICFDLIEKRGLPLARENIGIIILGTIEGYLHDVGRKSGGDHVPD